MSEYVYRARNLRGEMVVGRLEAESAGAVARQLASIGVTPVHIGKVVERGDVLAALRLRLGGLRPTLEDLLLFSRQMHSLTKAGVPLSGGLRNLAASARNPVMARTIREVVQAVESGRDLATSLGMHPAVFPTLFVSIVRVGEGAGRLDEAFLRMHQYLARERETRQQVRQALRYPAMVSVAIAIAIAVVTVLVIPAFAHVFERADFALPWPTRVILAVSQFMTFHWPALLAGLLAGTVWTRWHLRSEAGRYRWDRWKLRLPLVGGILERATLGRFARAFSICTSAGVPLIRALTLVAHAVDNRYLGERVLAMRTGVEHGETLTRTAQAAGLFTPLVLQMLAVGEETGTVEEMLHEVAEHYEREVEYDVRNLASLVEPVLLTAMGLMVLVLALGVFLPMWDLAQAAL